MTFHISEFWLGVIAAITLVVVLLIVFIGGVYIVDWIKDLINDRQKRIFTDRKDSKMIHIPDKVKIAGFTYEVQRPDKSFVNGVEAVDGTHDVYNQIIRVAREGSEDYQNMVFLHEMIHGVFAAYCDCTISADNEEKLVEQLSKGIYQVIIDNPEIFNGGLQ